MKVRFTACLLLLVTIVIISCSKEKDKDKPDPTPPVSTLLRRFQMGDTVILISYDENKRIKSVLLDSTYKMELLPTYDNAGNLISVGERVGAGVTYTPLTLKYNTDNLLTEVNIGYASSARQYKYEYKNGVLSKKSYYTVLNLNNPELELYRYYTYEVTNGNITSRKEYTTAGFSNEMTFTYTGDKNVFSPLALLGAGGMLEFMEINDENFFNKNLIAGYTKYGDQNNYIYTYDTNKLLTKYVISKPRKAYTWMISY